MRFTVFGGTGFIGRTLVSHLREHGHAVDAPSRNLDSLPGGNLGHVIYAIGLTGNFREQLRATVTAHVHVLQNLMEEAEFESWLYLSSTRVYGGLPDDVPASEDAPLLVRPGRDAIYDLSKLLGESICLAMNRRTVRVARLSNVYGAGQSVHSFLGSVLRDLARNGEVVIRESPVSSKDYISVDRTAEMLVSIATLGKERVYNVASGIPVTHAQLIDVIRQCGFRAEFCAGSPTRVFPRIDIQRFTNEFTDRPQSVLDDLPRLIRREAHRCHDN